MPAYLTHRAAGERVLEKLGAAVTHNKAFYFGCQGPDILFFRNYQPWRNSKDSLPLGLAMHRESTRKLIEHIFGFLKTYDKSDRDEVASYLAGFLTHYTTDSAAHPFVYGKAAGDTNKHQATEAMWDSFIASEQWGIEPEEFDVFSDVMYGEVTVGVEQWYASAAKEIYGAVLKPGAVAQAQAHLARAKKALCNIRLPHKALMKLLQWISGLDLRNMMYPEARNDSLFTSDEYRGMQNMIDRGVEEAQNVILLLQEFINGGVPSLPSWLGGTNFAGEAV